MIILKWFVILFVAVFAGTALIGAPFVPSRNKEVRLAFTKLYRLSSKDLLIDLGSGDGKVLKIANDLGAKALGIELNPFLVLFSKIRFWNRLGIKTIMRDFMLVDFPSETTVLYLFGDGRDVKKITRKVREQAHKLNRPLFVISYGFDLPDCKPQKKYRAYYLYKIE